MRLLRLDSPADIGSDQYMSTYLGFQYEESMDAYLQKDCPPNVDRTFLI